MNLTDLQEKLRTIEEQIFYAAGISRVQYS